MDENELSHHRGCIYKVYNKLGPGLLESAYIKALGHELMEEELNVKTEISLPMVYEGIKQNNGYRLDMLVNDKVIIEVKSVESLNEVHHKQLITYLILSGLKLGILVNFNSPDIAKSIFRKVNGL